MAWHWKQKQGQKEQTLPEHPHEYSFKEQELVARLLQKPRNEHHPLPQSRWNKQTKNKTISLNQYRHTTLWHGYLHGNMIASEIAAQWTIWCMEGYIFLGSPKGRFLCGYFAPGTLADSVERPKTAVVTEMTDKQIIAWDELFGLRTKPEIVLRVTNKYLLPATTPIDVVPSVIPWHR